MENIVTIQAHLSVAQASALAELLASLGLGDCRVFAPNESQARLMLEAVTRVQMCLATAGFCVA